MRLTGIAHIQASYRLEPEMHLKEIIGGKPDKECRVMIQAIVLPLVAIDGHPEWIDHAY